MGFVWFPTNYNSYRYVVGATLPDQNQEHHGSATVSGWGSLKSNGPFPDTLHAVNVPILTDTGNVYLFEKVFDTYVF